MNPNSIDFVALNHKSPYIGTVGGQFLPLFGDMDPQGYRSLLIGTVMRTVNGGALSKDPYSDDY